QGGILNTILEQKCVPAGAQPVQAGGRRDGAGVAVVAEPTADLLHSGANEGGVGETTAGEINLINIQRAPVDERAQRFSTALAFTCGNRDRRPVTQPDVAIDVVLTEWFLEPLDLILRERLRPAKGSASVVDAAGINQQKSLSKSLSCPGHKLDINR